jgi:tRNA threonylcarbamoyladenosine modification (KEOPS) complex Cgi121 subunit
VESTSLIVKEFNIKELNLHFYVAINQIQIDLDEFVDFYNINKEKDVLKLFFQLIEEIQNKYENSVVQFVKDQFITNYDHIFMACYNLERAFLLNLNISNKKKIELLLYLAANRQISKSIEAFGIDYNDLNKKICTFCLISQNDNLNEINEEILQTLKANETKLTINNQSLTKFKKIKEFFNITEDQINVILSSYGIQEDSTEISLNSKYSAIHEVICEKMALLSLEQVKTKKI